MFASHGAPAPRTEESGRPARPRKAGRMPALLFSIDIRASRSAGARNHTALPRRVQEIESRSAAHRAIRLHDLPHDSRRRRPWRDRSQARRHRRAAGDQQRQSPEHAGEHGEVHPRAGVAQSVQQHARAQHPRRGRAGDRGVPAHAEMKRLLLVLLFAASAFADHLYVSNERAGTIQIIDTATDRVIASRNLGNRPRGLAVSPDGKRLYVALSWWRDGKHPRSGREAIVALDTNTLKTIRDYVAATDPECVAVSPDGKRLFTSNEDAATASILDVANGKSVATLVVGTEPEGVAASPDGKWVYVTGESSNTISVVDTAKKQVVANILLDPRPRATVFTRDAKRAWATAEIGASVMLIDVTKHRLVQRIKLPNTRPVGLVLTPDEKRLYVATGRGNSVAVIDTAAKKIIATIPAGNRVWGIAMTHDGRKVYAANSLSNTITVIDTAANRVVNTIKTDDGPWGLARH